MSEKTITEFPIFWGTCFYTSISKGIGWSEREKRESEFLGHCSVAFLLNPVLLIVVLQSTSHYRAKNTMSSGKKAIIIYSQVFFY